MRPRSIVVATLCALVVSAVIGTEVAMASPTRGPKLPAITSIDAPEGPSSGGTKVVISGDHLDHASSVTFGRRAATSVSVKGAHRIIAETPRHPVGETVVHVVTPAGRSAETSGSMYRFGPKNKLHWSNPETIDPSRGNPQAISCGTTTFCALIDEHGLTTFDGATWTDVTPAGFSTPDAVYCWSATLCFADGHGSVSTYDGTTWSAPVPTFAVALEAISCWSDVGCRAFDWKGDELRYDGTSWSSTGRNLNAIIGLTCSAAESCTALNDSGRGYSFDGTSWTSSASLPTNSYVDWDACAPDGTCLATTARTGTAAYKFDGTSWVAIDDAPFAAQSLSCASATFCVALSEVRTASVYNGSSWSSPTSTGLPDTLRPVVGCAAQNSCIIVDHTGIATTFDGTSTGSTWQADPFHGSLRHVSCPTSKWCMSTDQFGSWQTRNDSGDWSRSEPGAGSAALSCSSSAFCISAAGSWAWAWHSGAWSRLPDLPTKFDAASSSCPVDGHCVVFDRTGRAEILARGVWRASGRPLTGPAQVSCWSNGGCLAVGHHRAKWLGGNHWSAAAAVAGAHFPGTLTSVDCVGEQRCFVGTAGGAVIHVTGHHRSITDHVLSNPVRTLDCADTTTCVAIGVADEPNGTRRLTSALYSTQGWSASAQVDPAIRAIACPTETTCVAVGGATAFTASVPAR